MASSPRRTSAPRPRAFGLLALLALLYAYTAHAYVPSAVHKTIVVSKNSDTIIELEAYDTDAETHSATITSLPASGTLYQVSANYITYGYAPYRAAAITAANTALTGGLGQLKLVYHAPLAFVPCRFLYTVTDASSQTSVRQGIIDLVLADRRTVYNDFNFDAETWAVVTALPAVNTIASWTGTSTGLLNHYIYSGDPDPIVGSVNTARWYFASSSIYTRNHANTYGGSLQFTIGAFAGDFSSTYRRATPVTLVTLDCATCNSNAGVTLAIRDTVYTGSITRYSFTLTESGGWLVDPRDTRVTSWSAPTQCQFLTVLANLSGVRIFGSLTTTYEALGIDSVALVAGGSSSSGTTVPTACYDTSLYGGHYVGVAI